MRGIVLCILLIVTPPTFAAEYSSIRQLLIDAIDSKDGTKKGTLVGPLAEHLQATLHSFGRVQAEVTTIRKLKQEDCRRLNLRLTLPNALATNGERREFSVDYGINMCRDGNPPLEK